MYDPIVLHDDADEVWIVKSLNSFMPSYKVHWLLDGKEKYKQTFQIELNGQEKFSNMFDALLKHVSKWDQCEVSPVIKFSDPELARGWKQPLYLKRLPDEYTGNNNV